MRILKKIFSNKYLAFSAIIISAFVLSTHQGFCADATLANLSCSAPSAVASWPRNTFTSTCTVDVAMNDDTEVKIGVYVANYTTTRNSGNGSNITLTSPEHRFKADGPAQAGTPANITTGTTGGTATIVASGITTDTSGISVDVEYTTYEADYGDTNYTQPFTFALYRDNNAAIDTIADSMTFDIENKQYITVSSAPAIALNTSAEVFNSGAYFDSNTITIYVKANNTWILKTKIASLFQDASARDVPTYFKCGGSGFSNLAATRTQYAAGDTLYNAAENTGGNNRTGTSDNISLDAVSVTFTLSMKNDNSPYDKGSYVKSTTFEVTSPKP